MKSVPNHTNSTIISDFNEYMKSIGCSEHHHNNNLKAAIAFARFLGADITFYEINKREQIVAYLDTKIKSAELEPDKKWITTWNHYLHRIKLFMRWLYNQTGKQFDDQICHSDWNTPEFVKIQSKKFKRVSPYLESEVWERDEILFITKDEPYKRNKAALTLFWDLDAGSHTELPVI